MFGTGCFTWSIFALFFSSKTALSGRYKPYDSINVLDIYWFVLLKIDTQLLINNGDNVAVGIAKTLEQVF